MKGKKSPPKKAAKSAKKSTATKASSAKKSPSKSISKPVKRSSVTKTSAPAKKRSLKKASAPAKKAALKKISQASTIRPVKKSSAGTRERPSKKIPTPTRRTQAPDSNLSFDVAFWLGAFQTTMDIYLDLNDENPYKADLVDEMEDCLIQALQLDGDHVPTLILFAAFRLDFGEKLDEAVTVLQKADKLSPRNKKVRTLMQRCEQAMNDMASAKQKSSPTKKRQLRS